MIFQTYRTMADVNATTDVSEILVYVNEITNGWAMPSVLFALFMIVFIGGLFTQIRFKGAVRPEVAFVTAGFITVGLAVLMSLKDGLLLPRYLFTSFAIALLGIAWVYLSQK